MKIDKTYIVNLEERIDRLVPLIDKLKSINFPYWVFKATKNVDGKLGLLLTMEKLLLEAMFEGHKTLLVLEDDCKFLTDDLRSVSVYMDFLPEGWDCLYLGVNLYQDSVNLYSGKLIPLTSGYATHAIVYSSKGMRKVLEAIRAKKHNHLPFDEILVRHIQSQGNSFCTFPMLITQQNGYSDIEGREVNYDKFLTDRFEEKTKHLKK